MLFNSYEFILAFLPITLAIFFLLTKYLGNEPAIGWLVLASLFFYGWWNPAYLGLILVSMLFNYGVGRALGTTHGHGATRARRLWLATGVAANLGLLGYFKYGNFFVDNINHLAGTALDLHTIVLPLAISFFTFQQVAYLADAYRGITREYRFTHYALFVTFFPQLIAGPIVHHAEMLPQFMRSTRLRLRSDDISIGLTIFSIGLVKKAVLADGVAAYATPVFDAAAAGGSPSLLIAWGGALAYTMQLYFDFSGYSDMAIGAARLFGIRLPLNFHSPYKATTITEFWRRWHITLSRFLRDYLYIPLGGNRWGQRRRYVNLMATMLLGGLWHGAAWTFVVWGGLHGVYLVIHHGWQYLCRRSRWSVAQSSHLWRGASWLLTFLAVIVGWIFFRAPDFATADRMLVGMVGINGVSIPNAIAVRLGGMQELLRHAGVRFHLGGGTEFVATWLWIFVLLGVALALPNTQEFMDRFEPAYSRYKSRDAAAIEPITTARRRLVWTPSRSWAVLVGVLSALGILALSSISEFLYFQF